MGWKAVEEHFKIKHIVCITHKGLCIGSAYIHDIAVINPSTGEVRGNIKFLKDTYPLLLEAGPVEIKRLLGLQDQFQKSMHVYTYKDGKIIEEQCEEYGWPNVTHGGSLMYNNEYFGDRKSAVDAGKEEAAAGIRCMERRVTQIEGDLEEAKLQLEKEKVELQGYIDLENKG
jgi:hypothetical protein